MPNGYVDISLNERGYFIMSLKNKKVFVTGAEGFIGSHLVESLVKEGALVKALTLYNFQNNWGWLETIHPDIKKEIEVVTGDIRDPFFMQKSFKQIDYVFHLAALIAIPFSYTAPNLYLETNTTGTLNVLEAAKLNECERLFVTSTSEVYGTAKYVPIDENHPFQGQSPYSASKIAADRFAESYYRSFGLPVSIVRPFNTFGPRQSARAIIPTLITQMLKNEKIRLGALKPTRDFVFVEDTVRGFIEIAKSSKTIREEINIATSQEISIENLVNLLRKLLNKDFKIETDEARLRPDNSEVFRLCGSNKKIQELTNWKPQVSFEEGLIKTIEWFKNNLDQYKTNLYNV